VYTLVHTYREWDEAHTRLLIEEFRRRHKAEGGKPADP
jgi:hypothetical protein